MKRIIYIFILLLLTGTLSAQAMVREKTLGLGFAVGEMTGISLKTWRGEETAIDSVLSWSRNDFKFAVSFLNHFFDIIDVEEKNMPVYYGLGSRVKISDINSDKNTLGLRFPGGISYIFPHTPLDSFIEVAPVLSLVPETALKLTVLLGLRYYF